MHPPFEITKFPIQCSETRSIQTARGHAVLPVLSGCMSILSGLSGKSVADSRFIDLETKADIFTRRRCFLHFMPVTVTSLVKKLHLSYHSLGLSVRSKRFRLVLEQKKTRNGIFGFDRARNETRTKK